MDSASMPLVIDRELLIRFEAGLDPLALQASAIPAKLIGFGEISAIFVIDADPQVAYKRMPLFATAEAAEAYALMHETYCRHLNAAGLQLPASASCVVAVPGRPVVLYIAQRRLPEDTLAHRRLWRLSTEECADMIATIVAALKGVWAYNRQMAPDVTLGIDGQLSNWALPDGPPETSLAYFDTSTPLMRIGGREQLDPELLLQAAPVFLRWLLRWCFVDDVVSRYYDHRGVLVDLIANLYKEQRPDLMPMAVDTVNRCRPADMPAIDSEEIRRYYRQDRLIWQLFLAFRRLDRWMCRWRGRRYEFILPGHIKR
ncbi:MAG: DUF6206 family protein [Pseudomonadota bacterium]